MTVIIPSEQTQAREIFFDNFFTGVETLVTLQEKNTKATGTIRENRCEKCPLIKSKLMKKQERRGFIDSTRQIKF